MLQLEKHQAIKKVILTPKSERANVRTESEYQEYDYSADMPIDRSEYIFEARDWELSIEVGLSEKVEKLKELLGDEEKAMEAWEIMNG